MNSTKQEDQIATEAANLFKKRFREVFGQLSIEEQGVLYLLLRTGTLDLRGAIGWALTRSHAEHQTGFGLNSNSGTSPSAGEDALRPDG